MRRLVARLQKKGSREVGIQTDEIEEYSVEEEQSKSNFGIDKIPSPVNSGNFSNFLSMPFGGNQSHTHGATKHYHPPEYSAAMMTKPNLLQFPIDEQRLLDLQHKFNNILSKTKKVKEGKPIIDCFFSSTEKHKKFKWTAPPFVLFFLENIINKLSSQLAEIRDS